VVNGDLFNKDEAIPDPPAYKYCASTLLEDGADYLDNTCSGQGRFNDKCEYYDKGGADNCWVVYDCRGGDCKQLPSEGCWKPDGTYESGLKYDSQGYLVPDSVCSLPSTSGTGPGARAVEAYTNGGALCLVGGGGLAAASVLGFYIMGTKKRMKVKGPEEVEVSPGIA